MIFSVALVKVEREKRVKLETLAEPTHVLAAQSS
jgi:hypothetical protein